MTAEVVILNNMAAVLAADSAVTIRTRRLAKTYNSASKIAIVSHDPPIGALVYGNADILGVPWESLKRMYRDTLRDCDDDHLATVGDVAAGFFDWLDENGEWLFGESAKARVPAAVGNSLDRLRAKILAAMKDGNASADDVVRRLTFEALIASSTTIQAEQQRTEVLGAYGPLLDSLLSSHAIAQLELDSSTWTQVGAYICDAVRTDALSAGKEASGIAFAGLGKRQFFPSLAVYQISGVLANRVVREETQIASRVLGDRPAQIVPLGQTSEIDALLQGVHPKYQTRVDEIFEKIPGRLAAVAFETLSSQGHSGLREEADLLEQAFARVVDSVHERLRGIRDENPVPLLEMVASLPTPELITAAEALVSLTALSQRMAPELETVGLPVDVAVASRSDGFVWVRRKQYYQRDLNPEMFQ